MLPSLLSLAMLATWASPVISSSLESLALERLLTDATPIFGNYVKETGGKADWMKNYHDETQLIHMNIPGTHDSATWNYSQATRASLLGITDLNQVIVPVPETFRCQDLSLLGMLNKGIRAFDLRYAFDPTNTTIVFYHSEALLSETATLDDVLFGFYKWLDDHPSETLFLSLQYEGSTAKYASNDVSIQLKLFNTLTSPIARKYFVQSKNELGTLGEARGKITLMRRFDLDQLADSYTAVMPGLHFSPSLWTDNDPNIVLTYNEKNNLTAYIEDYYEPTTPAGSTAAENIQWKYNATTSHIVKATMEHPDSLFWTWASSENTDNVPPVWPEIMAVGNGTLTPRGGVNQRLVPFLKEQRGKRVGIVMFDYFDLPSDLIDEFLSL